MQPRIDFLKYPEAQKAVFGVELFVRMSGLEPSLAHLVRLRASQLNHCAFCIDMHTKDARAAGETEQRLYGLSAWRETPFYTPRERAALEWTEALTLLSQNDIPDELYRRVLAEFPEPELVKLTMTVIAINAWNRVAVPFRAVPGSYQVPATATAGAGATAAGAGAAAAKA